MDKDTERLVKVCSGCTMAAKSPPVKFYPWPMTVTLWSGLHIDFAGPLNGVYYLIFVDIFFQMARIFKMEHSNFYNYNKILP